VIRAILFKIDAETAHRFALCAVRLLLRMGTGPVRILADASRPVLPSDPGRAPWNVLGMEISSPVGLAAGFDKDSEILAALPLLGFGFAEIGTVTPRPQPGNERPRLFRDPERTSLFNRMGFSGLGASIVSSRLAEVRPELPLNFRVGVNIGKNKDTPLEFSAADYKKAIAPFRDLADYVVINVSSPNTPGLRSLQTAQALQPIMAEVTEELVKWARKPPLLLKLAPELRGEALSALISELEASRNAKIDGWVLTNTLAGQIETLSGTLTGGWSGGAVVEGARRSLQEVRAQSKLPIVSVGGILSADEALLRMQMGADLVQIYTGWIYRGPTFPSELARSLREQKQPISRGF
jgi:dihydroorotate dehydrogenase